MLTTSQHHSNNNEQDVKHQFKVLTIGDSGVGKSSIIHRFANDDFNPHSLPTVGIDYKIKTLAVRNDKTPSPYFVKLSLWDTAGQERFRTITKNYFRGSHGMLLVYDVMDRKSFDNCTEWIKSVEESEAALGCVVFLVANKSDFPVHEVSEDEGLALADEFGVKFFKTSAKRDEGIELCFQELVRQMEIKHEQHEMARRISTASSTTTTASSAVKHHAGVQLRPEAIKASNTSCC